MGSSRIGPIFWPLAEGFEPLASLSRAARAPIKEMMLPRDAPPLDGWVKVLLVTGTWIVYVAMWPWGHGSFLHEAYLAWSVVPLLSGAWLYGSRLALPTGLAFVPLQTVLFLATGHPPGWELFGRVEGLVGQATIVAVTVLAGFTSDAHRRLAKMVESRASLVAAVSHEVRTPLTAVVGIAEMLNTNWTSMPEGTRHELVALIAEQATDMTAIVEDLLTAAKADQGKLAIKAQTIDLSQEAESVLQQMRISSADGAGSTSVVGCAQAWADPQRVRQVLRNLVVNARRYGGREIALQCGVQGSHAWLEVCDDGSGVPAGELEALFSPQAHTSDRSDSNGLGLALSRQLAVMMGGNLTYRREEGRTIFRLTLPKAVAVPVTVGS
jgi:signal transduction histidine kinase